MKWSRYSRLFESKRNGWLLFSAVSRTFLKVKDEEASILRQIQEDPEGFDYSGVPMLYMQLRSLRILVEDGDDEKTYNINKMNWLASLYGSRDLLLTIAVTTSCNFDCSYCFEANHRGHLMSQEAEDCLMRFIKSYRADTVHLTWYGGEPLLAWDRIISINRRLNDMDKPYTASMITNGYLMTEDKVKHLNELRIGYLQITLDGKKETHDTRRYLTGGGGTYDKILENIDLVMKSDFRGQLHIRVNVDGRNDEEFVYVYRLMQEKYPKDFGRRITVYPGFVRGAEHHADIGCYFDNVAQGEFIARMTETYNITPLNLFPPQANVGCVMTRRNGYVVGPDAELYQCWDDVGDPKKVVGSLTRFDNWDMGKIAEGMVGCSFLDDPECKECFYFPFCGGGCHRIRQNNLHSEKKMSSCTYFRGNLENLLELFYERNQQMKKEAAQAEAQAKGSGEEKA
ncbi:MAG: radical SAM protein [Clostridia bacterium]|nr:radical SAM protein [Clostridia bacterium]